MQRIRSAPEYFLQVVQNDEEPEWPRPEAELVVGSQPLDDGYTQFWAYPEDSGKSVDDLPPSEELAAAHHTQVPAILIDEVKDDHDQIMVNLFVVKDGHAWAKTESSIANLEDNISSLIEFVSDKFGFKVEHFMTTANVSTKVEQKLDELEKTEEVEETRDTFSHKSSSNILEHPVQKHHIQERSRPVETASADSFEVEEADEEGVVEEVSPFKKVHTELPVSGIYTRQNGGGGKGIASKLLLIIPLILILGVFGGVVMFRGKISSFIQNRGQAPTPAVAAVTPTPLPTVTPTPSVERSEYKVRVLNGTTKSGAASALGDDLKSKGWNVGKVGNAPKQNVEVTQVRVKADTQKVGDVLIMDLLPGYQASVSGELPEGDTMDAEVVIGLK